MWASLKKILKDHQDRGIIIEDGEPRYVILSIEAYNRLAGESKDDVESATAQAPGETDEPRIDLSGQETPKYPQDIRVEDLPF